MLVTIAHTTDVEPGHVRAFEIRENGAEAVGSSPEEFAAFIKSESEKWAKVASAAGIKPE